MYLFNIDWNAISWGFTSWCTLTASVMAPTPHLAVTFTQQESGTEFRSDPKFLQSEELFAPQHFNCRWKTFNMNTAAMCSKRISLVSTDGAKNNSVMSCSTGPTGCSSVMWRCCLQTVSRQNFHWTHILLQFIHSVFELSRAVLVIVDHVGETVLDDVFELHGRHEHEVKALL